MPAQKKVAKKLTLRIIRDNLGKLWHTRGGALAVVCWVAPVSVQDPLPVKCYMVRNDPNNPKKVMYQEFTWCLDGRYEEGKNGPDDLYTPHTKTWVF